MVDVIEIASRDDYELFYKCSKCGCDDIRESHKFCPICGEKITQFLSGCFDRSYVHGYHVCELETGHEGLHKDKDFEWE